MDLVVHETFGRLPICIICRQLLNSTNRLPYTQPCQHSICHDCLFSVSQSPSRCPIHDVPIRNDINLPLAKILACLTKNPLRQSSLNSTGDDALQLEMDRLTSFLEENLYTDSISPQLKRKLLHLIEATPIYPEGRQEFIKRMKSLFSRLLLELIQAHRSTKDRETDFRRLLKEKNCSINPDLTDAVIYLIVELYKATDQSSDSCFQRTSFQRKVLVNYLVQKLNISTVSDRKQVAEIIQTLYRCSCFNTIQMDGESARLKLKEGLLDIASLRQQHDLELMKLALENNIRLPPDSWSFLLYGQTSPDHLAIVQSLIDRCPKKETTVSELIQAINRSHDKFRLSSMCGKLKELEDNLNFLSSHADAPLSLIRDNVWILNMNHYLFQFRKYRCVLSDEIVVG